MIYQLSQRCHCGVSHKSSHFILVRAQEADEAYEADNVQETAINIGVATGLLAAEQGELERPMCLGVDTGTDETSDGMKSMDQFGSIWIDRFSMFLWSLGVSLCLASR